MAKANDLLAKLAKSKGPAPTAPPAPPVASDPPPAEVVEQQETPPVLPAAESAAPTDAPPPAAGDETPLAEVDSATPVIDGTAAAEQPPAADSPPATADAGPPDQPPPPPYLVGVHGGSEPVAPDDVPVQNALVELLDSTPALRTYRVSLPGQPSCVVQALDAGMARAAYDLLNGIIHSDHQYHVEPWPADTTTDRS